MTAFWRYWLYYATPSTYWVGGILAATLHDKAVVCSLSETARFYSPPGQTCESYAREFIDSATGYLMSSEQLPDLGAGECAYCPYSLGDDYLATLNIAAADKWPCLGVFLAFCVSNMMLVYFFIYWYVFEFLFAPRHG